jgi:hypothetical protein
MYEKSCLLLSRTRCLEITSVPCQAKTSRRSLLLTSQGEHALGHASGLGIEWGLLAFNGILFVMYIVVLSTASNSYHGGVEVTVMILTGDLAVLIVCASSSMHWALECAVGSCVAVFAIRTLALYLSITEAYSLLQPCQYFLISVLLTFNISKKWFPLDSGGIAAQYQQARLKTLLAEAQAADHAAETVEDGPEVQEGLWVTCVKCFRDHLCWLFLLVTAMYWCLFGVKRTSLLGMRDWEQTFSSKTEIMWVGYRTPFRLSMDFQVQIVGILIWQLIYR